jgi:hypothetical protein
VSTAVVDAAGSAVVVVSPGTVLALLLWTTCGAPVPPQAAMERATSARGTPVRDNQE